jgi:uncharacterized protein (TIGR02569 family)
MVPEEVCQVFGLTGDGRALSGGMHPAFRFGDVVVKSVDDEVEGAYIAEVMDRVVVDETLVRVARPVTAKDGRWVAQGWAAWRWEEGGVKLEDRHPWDQALSAVEELHRGLAVFPPAPFLRTRSHAWAQADLFAWRETHFELRHPETADLVAAYLRAYRPVEVPAQLVHGDTYPNLLFAAGRPPAIIDFSPYWRPVGWARAMYVFSALWHTYATEHAFATELLERVPSEPGMHQLLLRAAVFRLVSRDRYTIELGLDPGENFGPHRAIARLLDVVQYRVR